jgi:hypothetical protein
MTDSNRFFRFLWRANALVIFCVALLAGLLGLYGLFYILKDNIRNREVTDVLIVNPEQQVEEETILGYPRPVAGTAFVRIPLYREQKTNISYYSKSSNANTVNEIFVDGTTGESVWLFKGTQRLILGTIDVLSKLKAEAPLVTAVVYTIADEDTDANGRLTSSDHVNVGFSNPQGTKYTSLLDGVEKLFATEQIADDRLMVVYAKNGESRLVTFSLPAFNLIKDMALPKLEAQP